MDKDNFDYGVEYGAENTKLVMNSLSAFESVYFQMNSESNSKGTVEINAAKKDGKISGIINNKMSCDLEDCIFYDKGMLYYIGSLPAGRAFDLAKTPNKDIYDENKYSFDFESQLSDAIGGDFYSSTDNDIKRKFAMIMQFSSENTSIGSWFYGFVTEGSETGFTDALEYDKYGKTGVYKVVEVSEKINGYDIIGSLEGYVYNCDTNKTNGYYIYDYSNTSFDVEYKFPKNFNLKKIIYNKDTAQGCEFQIQSYGYTEYAFLGEAKVLDKDTGKYVTIIESGKDAEIDDIEKYIEDDGTLTIHYETAYSQNGNYNVDNPILPRVSLAGKYKRR